MVEDFFKTKFRYTWEILRKEDAETLEIESIYALSLGF